MTYKKGGQGPTAKADLKAQRIARLYARTPKELDALLRHCGAGERAQILRRITPHLKFPPN